MPAVTQTTVSLARTKDSATASVTENANSMFDFWLRLGCELDDFDWLCHFPFSLGGYWIFELMFECGFRSAHLDALFTVLILPHERLVALMTGPVTKFQVAFLVIAFPFEISFRMPVDVICSDSVFDGLWSSMEGIERGVWSDEFDSAEGASDVWK